MTLILNGRFSTFDHEFNKYTNYGKEQQRTTARHPGDDGGLHAQATEEDGDTELTEQREQSQTTFELCRVATEVGESQRRQHAERPARRTRDDHRGLSVPVNREAA